MTNLRNFIYEEDIITWNKTIHSLFNAGICNVAAVIYTAISKSQVLNESCWMENRIVQITFTSRIRRLAIQR